MSLFRRWYDTLPERRRAMYGLFISITLLTLPCYGVGLVALAIAPSPNLPTPRPSPGGGSAVPGRTVTAQPVDDARPTFNPDR